MIPHDITPTVTVLVPVYNAGRLLQESVESILTQTYAAFELLFLDDGSTDGCSDFLTHIKKSKHTPPREFRKRRPLTND